MKMCVLRSLGAVLSGGALSLCFPPFHQTWLVWGWLWLLFPILWTARSKKQAFAFGYLAGFAFWAVNMKWILTVSWVGVIAIAAYLALYFGFFALFAATAGNPWRKETPVARSIAQRFRECGRSLGFAALLGGFWCGLEWIRGWFLTGFGWNGLGVTFYDTLVLAQNAEFIGVIGLSFLPVFFSAVVVQVARRFYRHSMKEGAKFLYWDLATCLIVLMIALSVGTARLSLVHNEDVIKADILLVQQDIPQLAHQVTWTANEIIDGFIELTENKLSEIDEAAAKELIESQGAPTSIRRPDMVVWPETALLDRFYRQGQSQPMAGAPLEGALSYFRRLGQFVHLTGVVETDLETNESWNSILQITPENERATYRKQHRVLFGEYIPDIKILRQLYEHSAGVEYYDNIAAGKGNEGLSFMIRGEAVEMIPSICFEDTVPRQTRKFVKDIPQVIVNVTNDGWFQESEGAAQHFANARFRAIEIRRPMIRCANRGTTGIISVTGSTIDPVNHERRELIDENGSHFTRGTLLASVYIPRSPIRTLYSLYGDWFAVLGLVSALLWLIIIRIWPSYKSSH